MTDGMQEKFDIIVKMDENRKKQAIELVERFYEEIANAIKEGERVDKRCDMIYIKMLLDSAFIQVYKDFDEGIRNLYENRAKTRDNLASLIRALSKIEISRPHVSINTGVTIRDIYFSDYTKPTVSDTVSTVKRIENESEKSFISVYTGPSSQLSFIKEDHTPLSQDMRLFDMSIQTIRYIDTSGGLSISLIHTVDNILYLSLYSAKVSHDHVYKEKLVSRCVSYTHTYFDNMVHVTCIVNSKGVYSIVYVSYHIKTYKRYSHTVYAAMDSDADVHTTYDTVDRSVESFTCVTKGGKHFMYKVVFAEAQKEVLTDLTDGQKVVVVEGQYTEKKEELSIAGVEIERVHGLSCDNHHVHVLVYTKDGKYKSCQNNVCTDIHYDDVPLIYFISRGEIRVIYHSLHMYRGETKSVDDICRRDDYNTYRYKDHVVQVQEGKCKYHLLVQQDIHPHDAYIIQVHSIVGNEPAA